MIVKRTKVALRENIEVVLSVEFLGTTKVVDIKLAVESSPLKNHSDIDTQS